MRGLLAELRRRHVFRVAGLYLFVSWLLLQAASILENSLGLPPWFDGMVTALVLLGFPVALLLAWAFELTPEGIQRATPDPRPRPAQWGDALILVALFAVAGLIVFDRLGDREAGTATPAPADAVRKDGAPAIAVLPFVDLSPNRDQSFFSDGLSEEILNVLAQDSGLAVAGRTSSFAFKGKNVPIPEIASALRVSHVLEGSVRRSGDRIRVTAQLVRADTGFHVFSETYDRQLREVFEVQDDIARRIARALRSRLRSTSPSKADAPSIEAYERFLAAREAVHNRTKEELERAEKLLEEVLALEPRYAPALGLMAIVTTLLRDAPGNYGTRPSAQALARARDLAERALRLDPDLADGHAVLGLIRSSTPEDDGDPRASLERALALNPSHTNAQLWLAQLQGISPAVFEGYAAIADRDPRFMPVVSALVKHHLARQEFDRARAYIERAAAIPGPEEQVVLLRLRVLMVRNDLVGAYRLLADARRHTPGSRALRLGLSQTLLHLGELDQAYAMGEPSIRMAARLAQGRVEEAVALALASKGPSQVPAAIEVLAYTGRPREAIAAFAAEFGQLEDLDGTRAMESLRTSMPALALAYGRVGDERRKRLALEQIGRTLAQYDALGYGGAMIDLLRVGRHLALDRPDRAVRSLERLVDDGALTAATRAFFPLDRLGPRWTELEATIWARVDRARAELGWKPFERPAG